MMILTDFYQSSFNFTFHTLLFCLFFFLHPFSRRRKDQANGTNFAKARWARAIQKVRTDLKTTNVLL